MDLLKNLAARFVDPTMPNLKLVIKWICKSGSGTCLFTFAQPEPMLKHADSGEFGMIRLYLN